MKGERGKAPAIQWYYKDWLSDSDLQAASATSRGVWVNLLMHMVGKDPCSEGYVPGALENMTLQRVAQLGNCLKKDAKIFISEAKDLRFCDIKPSEKRGVFTIISRRLSRDIPAKIEQRKQWSDRQRRKYKKDKTSRDSHGDITTDSQETHTPSPIPSPIPTLSKDNVLKTFDRFWSVCPRKIGKKKALVAWKSALKSVSAGQMIKAMEAQVAADHFKGQDGKHYIPHPTTWLNQGRWDDEISGHQPDSVDQRARAVTEYMRRKREAKQAGHNSGAGDGQPRLSAPENQ